MPVLFQSRIYRADLRRNPQVLYVFGDNHIRKGMGGQAAECRGEPNAVGVRTKYSPASYFSEGPAEVVAQNRMVDEDFKRLFDRVQKGGIVIWPTDGIGTGLAALNRYAPSTLTHIEDKLASLIRAAKLFEKETSA